MPSTPEFWQRGPIREVPPLLQPVAHALLQARDEVTEYMRGFPEELLWLRPAGLASVGFHLQHLSGVLDRVFTYARAAALTDEQFKQLGGEGQAPEEANSVKELVMRFNKQVDLSLAQIKSTPEDTLTTYRGIGRAALPSTVIGLLFHGAEHTMRHVGQLLVTVKVVRELPAITSPRSSTTP